MITFKKFLVEDSHQTLYTDSTWTVDSIPEIVKIIKRDCGKYLKEIKNPMTTRAYRGIKLSNISSIGDYPTFFKKAVRTDRRPKDTPKRVSELMDDWFEKKFGIRFRSESMFVTARSPHAAAYGPVFIVFPIGDYDYCWSPIYDDLTENLTDKLSDLYKQNQKEFDYLNINFTNVKKEHLEKIMDDGKYKLNRDLVKALSEKSEIMIKCKSYYALNPRWKDIYMDILMEL